MFIAEAGNKVQTMEDIGHEIVPLYMRDKVRFLSVLDHNPAFIPAVCSNLASYFSMEDKEKDLDSFIAQNRPLMAKHLYKPYAEICIAELEKHNLAFKRDALK